MDPVTHVNSVNLVGGPQRGAPRLEQPKPVDEQAAKLRKLRKASNDFEAIFISKLLKPLAESVGSSSDGKQLGGDVMVSVAMEKMAESIAQQGGLGLGDMLYGSLKSRIEPDSTVTVPDPGAMIPIDEPKEGPQPLDTGASPIELDRVNSEFRNPIK